MPQPYATTPADPRRFLRRHHYQEGPDFLFLATQNGRPANKALRPSLNEVRRRMRAIRLASEKGAQFACGQVGCSLASLYRWLAAFEAGGIEGLVPASRRPQRMRPTIPGWVDRVIIAIRLHTYWNSKRIAAEMRRRQIYQVSHGYIDGLLRAKGCARGSVPVRPGPRYERTRPNELWHIDIKGPFFINLAGRGYIKTWLVGMVDDHSRFVIGLRILRKLRPSRSSPGWTSASSSAAVRSS